ncbi:MAG TPA: ribosome maturation factor RimP [Acidimicrobiales bacterium]|nr:ribosome maturation factor RimP [Acidimicrobiales bacterium]
MSTADRVQALVLPILDAAGLDLYDLELAGGTLQILVDREGGAGIDEIATVSRQISRALDEHDPIDGHYTLEVSTPGLERPLRTPAHFVRAVGRTVKVKTRPGTEGDRRLEGTVTSVEDDAVTFALPDGTTRTLRCDDIERARTTFEWGGAAKRERKS